MIRVVWWTCALALATARIYDRCELARELVSYGVERDHISTWVCIAYHESRLDTAAQNHGSGDHGIFQISELFWCGPGKACGVPCTAFRDDDIRDDIQCSLQIHEEHTRLQGDGFLAWVVYPQHCKQNTKKYLADCDGISKNTVPKIGYTTSILNGNNSTYRRMKPALSQEKPSFLAVSDFVRESYRSGFSTDYTSNKQANWLDYKIKNVDELSIPPPKNNLELRTPTKTSTIKFETRPNSQKKPSFLAVSELVSANVKNGLDVNSISIKTTPKTWQEFKIYNVDELTLPGFKNNGYQRPIIVTTTTARPRQSFQQKPSYLAVSELVTASLKNGLDINSIKVTPKTWQEFKINNVNQLSLQGSKNKGDRTPIIMTTTARPRQSFQQKPSFLAISDFVRENVNIAPKTTLDYKIDNVDQLSVPVLKNKQDEHYSVSRVMTPTVTTPAYPIVPWRTIETNQFRNRMRNQNKDIPKFSISKDSDSTKYDKLTTNLEKTSESPSLTLTSRIISTTYKPQRVSTKMVPIQYNKPIKNNSTHRSPTVSSNLYSTRYTTPVSTTSRPQTFSTLAPFKFTRTTTKYNPWTSPKFTYRPSVYSTYGTTKILATTATAVPPTPKTTKVPWSQDVRKGAVGQVRRQGKASNLSLSFVPTKRVTTPSTKTYSENIRSTSAKPTQSIFDLYLNPTKRPPIPSYRLNSNFDSPFKLKIFAGGTTTPSPWSDWKHSKSKSNYTKNMSQA